MRADAEALEINFVARNRKLLFRLGLLHSIKRLRLDETIDKLRARYGR